MYQEETAYSRIKARIQDIGRDSIPELDFGLDRVMMITINKTLKDHSVYDAVRFALRVSKERADKASNNPKGCANPVLYNYE